MFTLILVHIVFLMISLKTLAKTLHKMLEKYQAQSSSGKLYARLFGKDNYGRQSYSNVCEFELS